ncbi:MAG: DUF4142 domain-containing protein, partial [Pseudolabrys sp.]
VRQYGAMLVKDHGDHKAKVEQVANELGVTPPTGSGIGAKATYAKLKMLSGASFDKSFAKAMVNEIQERGKQKRRRRPPGQRGAARPAKSVCRQHNLFEKQIAQKQSLR